ncbi:hypothetical protein Vadar_003091 [Vaccinium darrowii]|uniref:Uncharacterized protein n=1 Tax=Vaccinium darrowii TaxID=229202 RepID=A0ACB7XF39_9ERIC|nr:hypothetical protein Vadar_003091 [Vaccinium darrowii]
MSSFIKGRKLWRIIIGEIVKPTKEDTETQPKFAERLEDWDSKNHMMITWFRNTSVTSLSLQFGRFQNHDGPAKAIWDFLKERYSTTGLAHEYQLLSNLHRLRQEPDQSINDFLSQILSLFVLLFYTAIRFLPWNRLFMSFYQRRLDLVPLKLHIRTLNWSKSGSSKSGHQYKPTSHTTAAVDATSSSTLDTSVSNIEAIVKQVICSSRKPPPTALSTTSGPISKNSLTASPEEDVPSADLAPGSPQ